MLRAQALSRLCQEAEGRPRRAGWGGAGSARSLALKAKVTGEGRGKARVGVNGDSDVSFLKTWRIKKETLKSPYLKIIEGAGDAQPPGPPEGPPAGGARSRGHESNAPPELGALEQRQRPVTCLGEDAGSAQCRAPPGEMRGGEASRSISWCVVPTTKSTKWERVTQGPQVLTGPPPAMRPEGDPSLNPPPTGKGKTQAHVRESSSGWRKLLVI